VQDGDQDNRCATVRPGCNDPEKLNCTDRNERAGSVDNIGSQSATPGEAFRCPTGR
jgi:hypothetical protein